jgi:hypothetical protein
MELALIFAEHTKSEILRIRAKSAIKWFKILVIVSLILPVSFAPEFFRSDLFSWLIIPLMGFYFFVLGLPFLLIYISLLGVFSEELASAANRFVISELRSQYPPKSGNDVH